MKYLKQISACVLLSAGLFSTPSMAAECIAPANPGGGWDFTCRSIGKIMFDIGNRYSSGTKRLCWYDR